MSQKENSVIVLDRQLLIKGDVNTNFIFKVINYSPLKKITEKRKNIKKIIEDINNNGGVLEFHEVENKILKNNLILIDGLLPEILSEIILQYYTFNYTSLEQIVLELEKRNHLKYNQEFLQEFYKYKLKNFLIDATQRMNLLKIWDSSKKNALQYLVTNSEKTIKCFKYYERNQFGDYLIQNTNLETTDNKKHKFGVLYKDEIDNQYYLKLNLQIRFK